MTLFPFGCRRLAGALTLLLAGGSALARPTLEDYSALPEVQMMSVSPDGTMVAFRRKSGEQDLVVVYSLRDGKVVTVLDVKDVRPALLYFLDDSRVILVASEEIWHGDWRDTTPRISTAFSLDVTTSEFEQLLTPGDNIMNDQTGLGDIVGVSNDGRFLYMPAFVERGERPFFSLMEVDLESVNRPRLVMRGSDDTVDYFVDRHGNVLAEELLDNHRNIHSIRAYHDDGEEIEIFREQTEIPRINVVALTSDLRSLIFEAGFDATDRFSYYTMALEDGTVAGPIFEREDADVEAILTDINRIAYGVVYSGLTPIYEFFDEKLAQRVRDIQAQFPGNSVWIADASPDLRHLLVRVEGRDSSGDYYLFSEDGRTLFLASRRPEIPPKDVNPVIPFKYEARDGTVIPGLLTVPLAYAENPRGMPAVMLPHGGPESYDWLGFDWRAQALATEGYAVIQPQFRGSSGFGLRHLLAGRGEWGRKSQEDITDALKAMVEEGFVDPERVCIVGASYGGYAALAGGAFTPELYRCVVSISGVADVRMFLARAKSELGRQHWVFSYWKEVIARDATNSEALDSISPANFADRFIAPVLLVHGNDDNVVAFDQSRHMAKQLERAGKPVELVSLEGEDHHLLNPATRLRALEEIVAFVDRHIGSPDP